MTVNEYSTMFTVLFYSDVQMTDFKTRVLLIFIFKMFNANIRVTRFILIRIFVRHSISKPGNQYLSKLYFRYNRFKAFSSSVRKRILCAVQNGLNLRIQEQRVFSVSSVANNMCNFFSYWKLCLLVIAKVKTSIHRRLL